LYAVQLQSVSNAVTNAKKCERSMANIGGSVSVRSLDIWKATRFSD
jgi:hypothetical protein